MKTHTITTYDFDELSDSAKETAISEFQTDSDLGDFVADDYRETLKAFEKIFPVKSGKYEFGFCHTFINTDTREISGLRLRTWLINNHYSDLFTAKCYETKDYKNLKKHISKITYRMNDDGLTGMCYDWAILKPLYDFIEKPDKNTTFEDLFKDCLQSWVIAAGKDYEYQYSTEAITETIEANEYEFTENGKLYN